jgi:hypothetical protein
VLEREQGSCGGVVEVDPGEDTAAVAEDRELSLAHRLDHPVVGSSVAQDDAAGPHDRAVEIRHCGRRLAHPVHRVGALGAQPVGLREAAIEVSGELHTSCPRSIN